MPARTPRRRPMTSNIRHDMTEIRRGIAALFRAGDIVELRAIEFGPRKVVASGYFDDLEKAAEAAAKMSGNASGVYCVLNEINPALLARAANRTVERPKATTGDADVLQRRWLPIDIDAKRPAGISSTDAEHQAALDATVAVKDCLIRLGFLENSIVRGDSGNGGHVLIRVDLPNDDQSRDLVRACLEALAAQFDGDAVQVDRTVFNAARIWKLPGTLACKGDSTAARPHRPARLVEVPPTLEIAPIEALRALAATAPTKKEPTHTPTRTPYDPFELLPWLGDTRYRSEDQPAVPRGNAPHSQGMPL